MTKFGISNERHKFSSVIDLGVEVLDDAPVHEQTVAVVGDELALLDLHLTLLQHQLHLEVQREAIALRSQADVKNMYTRLHVCTSVCIVM